MFYSQFILAKKGPLGTIWIAAHLERKLRKNQVADTDIGVSVDSILFPDVPIALRLSSHLLLGVVRIYNRKVNYLFDDCSEALLKVKQAFRSTAVDLPPEESKAPYHSITLPETFDLDDFELPDSDIFQGNYVDHHVSSREQITLQDNIEGVSYSTSKFGLDERFGDGDASGLDLDEELFLDRFGVARHADESADPQASVGSMSSPKQTEHPEDRAADSDAMVDGADGDADVMDYAPGPSTPGLVGEPNLSAVQEVSVYDEHMDSECHAAEYSMMNNEKSNPDEDKQEVDWCSLNHAISDGKSHDLHEVNENQLGGLKIEGSKPEGESFVNNEFVSRKESSFVSEATSDLLGHDGGAKHSLELTDRLDVENIAVEDGKAYEIDLENISEISAWDNTSQQVGRDVSTKNLSSPGVDAPGSEENAISGQKLCPNASDLVSENLVRSLDENLETEAFQKNAWSCALSIDDNDKETSSETPFLRSCNTGLEQTDAIKSGCNMLENAFVKNYIDHLDTSGKQETAKQGEDYSGAGISEEALKQDQVDKPASDEQHPTASTGCIDQINTVQLSDELAEDLKHSEEALLPAPEKMLSVPESLMDREGEGDMLVGVSPGEFEMLEEGDAGSKTFTGKKRSFTESTLTEQSLNSVESSRPDRGKRTVESVPDDNDLLSSILVGRRSSVLKVKPTPPISEVTSVKRTRTSLHSGAPKRKVLMDDTMVLHGDTIRQQLMNTEDIRRVRKKAPCTRSEIRMIQTQHMKDEIFLETVFPGMSAKLASLHSWLYDLNKIRIFQNDATNAPEIMAEPSLPSQCEAVVGTKLVSTGENNDVLETHQVSHAYETGANHDIANIYRPDKPTIVEENIPEIYNEPLFTRDKEITETIENPILAEDRLEEINASQEQIKVTSEVDFDVSQQDGFLDLAEVETNQVDARSVTNVVVDASALVVQTATSNETGEPNSATNADVSEFSHCQKQDATASAVEFDFSENENRQAVVFNDCQTIDGDAIMENDGMVNEEGGTKMRDSVHSNVVQDGAADAPGPNAKYDELKYDAQNEIYDPTFGEQIPYSTHEIVLEDGCLNDGEKLAYPEAYHPNLMDADVSVFCVQDQYEFSHLATGNDTEFLNVDDDELNEMADDDILDGEKDARLTENTGWSSRTRAVSKFLQTTFMKEAESERVGLSMDNLLMGKTRKEASRMFFETLVLKTRDYIHVEQNNPFGDISMTPRTKLLKSDF